MAGAATFRRRRLVAAALAVGVLLAARVLLAGLGGGPLASEPPASSPAPIALTTYVVQPGDTVWSIARSLLPEGDVRPLVDRLAQPRRAPCPAPASRVSEPALSLYASWVRCPVVCQVDDKVVDSRAAEDGAAIRRRRECLACGRRFTTFERVEEAPLVVVKRSGLREPFDRAKVVAGLRAATKNRPLADEVAVLAAEIEESVRLDGPAPTTQQIGLAVLDRLRAVDEVAYVRFASVYKGFDDIDDFAREVGLLQKSTEPKRP